MTRIAFVAGDLSTFVDIVHASSLSAFARNELRILTTVKQVLKPFLNLDFDFH